MRKLLAIAVAALFAAVTTGSFAASHMGAAKDDKGMAKKEEMKKDAKGMKDEKGMAKKDEKKAAKAAKAAAKDDKGMAKKEEKKEEKKK